PPQPSEKINGIDLVGEVLLSLRLLPTSQRLEVGLLKVRTAITEISSDCKILVSVYETHTSRKSTKYMIGQLTVGKEKSSEDKHWSLMMRSIRQPIAKWHSLLI
uniref:Uncharacterized protein n=1 Tax=Monopterus albus TaxID=43700 RepID=A0A3Q3KCQ1_MONAL